MVRYLANQPRNISKLVSTKEIMITLDLVVDISKFTSDSSYQPTRFQKSAGFREILIRASWFIEGGSSTYSLITVTPI